MSNPSVPVSLVPFDYSGRQVRTVTVNNEPWFVAVDVCSVLDIGNPSQAVSYLDDDEHTTTLISSEGGQQRPVNIINEPGLYSLILRSRKPEAKAFKRWVTHEVLPAIRKTGRFEVAALSPRQLAELVIAEADRAEAAERRVAELAPSAAAWDQLADTADDYSLREAAQMLCRAGINTGQNRLLRSLRTLKWVDTHGEPYQRQVDSGRLARRTGTYDHPHHGEPQLKVQTRVTPKGVAYLREHLGDGGLSLDLT